MNRRIATSQKTDIGDAPLGDGEAVGQSRAGVSPHEKPTRQKKSAGAKAPSRSSGGDDGAPGNVGKLLRGAYRQAVDEAIPDDLMDLLNKLE